MNENPFEKYRAFCAYLSAIPKEAAAAHLYDCLAAGDPDASGADESHGFYVFRYYYERMALDTRESLKALIEKVIEEVRKDAKNYDLSGFEFIEKVLP